MPRTPASPADQQLVAHAAAHGHEITARQVERWRGHGLLPPNIRSRPGRGRGSGSRVAEESFELVVWLAEHAGPGRRPHSLALDAFAAGLAVPDATVRAAFANAIDGLQLTVERTLSARAEPEDIADAAIAAGARGLIVPARVRRIDHALAEQGTNWADPTLARLDPGFGAGQKPATPNDWTYAAITLVLAGGDIDMATIGGLARSLLPPGAAAPLAGQVEYGWPISDHTLNDPQLDKADQRGALPEGDLREFARQLALVTPVPDLRDAWRVAMTVTEWAQNLCAAVEQELAEHVRGAASDEWITTVVGLGRLVLILALREPQPTTSTIAIRSLVLVFVRTMMRSLRERWPTEGHFEILEHPLAGPRFLTDFFGG